MQITGLAWLQRCTWLLNGMRHEEIRAILVVEDDLAIRQGLAELLATQGFRVATAKDGQEALDLLQGGFRPNLFLIDLMLPKVTGRDILRYTREDPDLRSIPTIIVTAQSELTHLIADEIFTKPVDVARLLDSVRRLAR